ncbi:MAG: GntR family transcriptional regulator [Defluviitaleaceae bacterium]|nr:GntR family transcriptional regulator [Defluviitaleaceae bacterium]
MATGRASTLVYDDIRAKIIAGELHSGTGLIETDLAEQYGVSRSTVKKALLMLEGENLVSIELNKGAKVRTYSLEEVLEYLEVRGALEGLIASLATQVISAEDIVALSKCFEEMQASAENQTIMECSKHNQEFHEIIYNACPNRTLVNITVTLKNQMSKYNAKTILVPGRRKQSLSEHKSILEAISAGESTKAETLMRNHIANVRKVFEEYYELLF